MKKNLFLLFLFLFFYRNINAQPCPSIYSYLSLNSQTEIDDFSVNFPGLTELPNNLIINSDDIINLDGLSQLTSILGCLTIQSCSNLSDLTGLENIISVGGRLEIFSNNLLINLQGLEGVASIGGDLVIQSNENLSSLSGLENINEIGNGMRISFNNQLISLQGLNAIHTISNNVLIETNSNLTNLSGLENLIEVNGDFRLDELPILNDISALSNVSTISGNLRISDCVSLINLSGLESIASCENLYIWNNDGLASLSGLNNLMEVTDVINITNCNNLTSFSGLGNLKNVGGNADINRCNSIMNFEGLENLETIGGRFWFYQFENLIDMTGLENLDSIGGNLIFFENMSLTNIEAFENLEYVGGDIRIGSISISSGNPSLESLKGLENITRVNGHFQVDNCPKIKNLEGLENITFIEETLWIRDNDSLKNLWGLHHLDTLGADLWIIGNDTLDHLGAIGDVVFSDMNNLRLSYNPNLSLCDEYNICNYLSNGGNHIISNNQSGCTELNELLDSCNDRFSKIEIQAFYDFNENQIRDSNEVILPSSEFFSSHLNTTFFSNSDNGILFYVDSGNYFIEYQENLEPIWSLTTDSISYSILVDNSNQCDSLFFGFYPNEQISNSIAFITGPPARCGEFKTFEVHTKNLGTTITNGTLWLEVDEIIDSTIFVDTPDTIVSPNLYGWHFENLYPGYSFDAAINLQVPIPPDVMIGDSLRFNSYVEYSDVNGATISDNFYYPTEVRCSFDPNDKLVNPSRNNSLTLFEEDLIYTIRFQNTGNDEAYDIIIRDTLDENLDPTTFRVLSTSHPSSLITSMEADQFLTFNFENIYLPDSTTNFDESQGYVSYMISPKEGLDEETPIENTASIYFDFNPPIVTNTTENIMVSEFPTSIHNLGGEEGMKIEIFPNPVSENIFIKKENNEKLEYQITDVNGRLLIQGELVDEIHNITFTKMNSGIYFIKIINPKTQQFVVDKIVK